MWRWIKIPKAVALVAFALPWLTVSCSNTVLLSASGWALASGHLSITDPMTGATQMQQGDVNGWLIAALVLTIIGLAASFLRGRAALIVLATSVAALLMVVVGTQRFSDKLLQDEVRKRRPGPDAERIARLIHIDRQPGYWLELVALITAAGMAGLVATGKDHRLRDQGRLGALGRDDDPPPR